MKKSAQAIPRTLVVGSVKRVVLFLTALLAIIGLSGTTLGQDAENITLNLIMPSYPYADFNQTYTIQAYLPYNDTFVNVTDLNMTFPTEGVTYGFLWTDPYYEITLIFTQEKNFSYTIFGDDPVYNITNLTGELLVRTPFYATLEAKKVDNDTRYMNDFAYVTAEFTDEVTSYFDNTNYWTTFDDITRNTIRISAIEPFDIEEQLYGAKNVFHAQYLGGIATLKLWEKSNYTIRMADGDVSFKSDFAKPVMKKRGSIDATITSMELTRTTNIVVLFSNRELNFLGWLCDWIAGFLIILGFIILCASIFTPIPMQVAGFAGIWIGMVVIVRGLIWLLQFFHIW